MKLLYLILIFASYNQIQCLDKHKKCETYLNALKQSGSLFLMCSMHFAVPVKFCINCAGNHSITVENYNKLIEAIYHNNTTNETEICKEKYFNQDRLNIVQTLYDEINGLWQKAYCNECFDGNGTVNTIILDILNQLVLVNGCLQKRDPCFECQSLYLNLNDLYTRELEQKFNNKVCFDIQDAMNRTRFLWSKKLHCCDRVVNLTAFAAVSSVIACLPILFYITMYFYTKRVERNHDMLLDNSRTEALENINSSTVINPVISAETNTINSSIPVSSREAPETSYRKDFKNNLKDIETENDSDDYMSPNTSGVSKQQKNPKKLQKQISDSDDEPIIHGTPEEFSKSSLATTKPSASVQNEKIVTNEPLIHL